MKNKRIFGSISISIFKNNIASKLDRHPINNFPQYMKNLTFKKIELVNKIAT